MVKDSIYYYYIFISFYFHCPVFFISEAHSSGACLFAFSECLWIVSSLSLLHLNSWVWDSRWIIIFSQGVEDITPFSFGIDCCCGDFYCQSNCHSFIDYVFFSLVTFTMFHSLTTMVMGFFLLIQLASQSTFANCGLLHFFNSQKLLATNTLNIASLLLSICSCGVD